MTLVLGIDTSTDVRVGVARDGEILSRRHVADTRQHVEQLIPLTRAALTDAGAGLADVDLICVGLGPGPFTGLRVGIVAAQTLASVRGIPLHGVCSLDVIAAATTGPAEFVVATDARRKELYWARYVVGTPLAQRIDGPHVTAPEDLPPLPVVGPGVAAYADRLPAHAQPGPGDETVDAGLLAALGTALPSAGSQPLYLRRPDAAEPTRRKSALARTPVRRIKRPRA
ncbi:tRNA (adenosine(37)-N6)-threonylcarbamoyltransferase complex dimerization subunit type 1 TsaB [Granulicoccus sp. GXG6511]|uniref:tRNA (adenosine(37)-N6)-threonylcarbamoyltransferase complex dimerization subunit type 1 TsaB n=1 Tax=Granulicoccus sp. GXG6511 TaxID=3381351 RepID=UPI003D7D92B4